ncbi:MAG: isoprenylcysteine carboxylmethyltransferase family protein [Chloroflexi bacterium]|nr:isoprenylcysteine carboxylmethyltransferase family protein [Chloroflexota bacterium]
MISVLIITITFTIWAVVHSILADHGLKKRFRERFGDRAYRWYRLAYNLFAILSFVPVLLAYGILPNQTLWSAPAPWRWIMLAIQAIGLIGIVVAVFHTHVGEFAGVAQLRSGYDPDRPEPMRINGLYCMVRHPIYFFGLLLVWFSPDVTVNGLTFAILVTLYFYFGAKHEETGLRAAYGPIYDAYREQVPMLIPRPQTCSRIRRIVLNAR